MAKQVAAVSGLQPYPAYKPSGVEWLGDVPSHWEVRRLRTTADMRVSNVDKHVREGESPVRLCNYVDVYNHDHISQQIEFMRATATCKEIKQFRLEKDDVLITKDSEAWDDIGVPAVVTEPAEDLISGYHLALLRPVSKVLIGSFLLRALQSKGAAHQFHVEAKGVTRYGLSHSSIKSTWIALPPLSEQAAIARYLDHADRRIRRCIQAKEKLVKLLEEQKQAIIHLTVTGQINVQTRQPYEVYKPSQVEWLGNVPEHWETRPSKRTFTPRKEFARPNDIQLSATQGYGVIAQEDYEKKVGRKIVRIFRHLEKRRHVEVDDFVISMRSFQGGLERAWVAGCIRSSYIVLQPATALDVGYFSHLFKSTGYIGALQSTANFIRDGQDLTFENFCGVDLPFPPFEEQRRIAQFLDRVTSDIATTIDCFRSEIDSLGEYRTRMIADVVTGKLDVRQADQIPDEIEEPEILAASDVQASVVAEAAGQLDASA